MLLSIPAQSLSLFSRPAPPGKSISKVSAVFTQPLAQITSYRLRPAGCGGLSLRVNDLAGCPLAGGGGGGKGWQVGKKEKKEVGIHRFKLNKSIKKGREAILLIISAVTPPLLSAALFPLDGSTQPGNILRTVAGFQ